jgi:hypothetical protein
MCPVGTFPALMQSVLIPAMEEDPALEHSHVLLCVPHNGTLEEEEEEEDDEKELPFIDEVFPSADPFRVHVLYRATPQKDVCWVCIDWCYPSYPPPSRYALIMLTRVRIDEHRRVYAGPRGRNSL